MGLKDEVGAEIDGTLNQPWDDRDGNVVPETEDVALAGGAVRLSATMLYSDLADSTELSTSFDRRIAAKVIKAFLGASSRIIRANKGYIRSFDGDRVMAVFLGTTKNTNAAKTALKINWAVLNPLKPKVEARYPSLGQGGYVLRHCVGVDTSDVLAVRAGIRASNDLVWVGRSPNVAAKLSAARQTPYHSYVTSSVYDVLMDEAKVGGTPPRAMWESCTFKPAPDVNTVYRSSWTWVLD